VNTIPPRPEGQGILVRRVEETVSMAYYSMYYMLLALLFKTGIKCENHSGAMILLERLYGIDNHGTTKKGCA